MPEFKEDTDELWARFTFDESPMCDEKFLRINFGDLLSKFY